MKHCRVEKIVRDLRVQQIAQGTNESMRVMVSRQKLGRNLAERCRMAA